MGSEQALFSDAVTVLEVHQNCAVLGPLRWTRKSSSVRGAPKRPRVPTQPGWGRRDVAPTLSPHPPQLARSIAHQLACSVTTYQ